MSGMRVCNAEMSRKAAPVPIPTREPFAPGCRSDEIVQAERIADAVTAITGEPTHVTATSTGGPVVWVTIGGHPRRLARVRSGKVYVRTRWARAHNLVNAVHLAVEAIAHLDDGELDEEDA